MAQPQRLPRAEAPFGALLASFRKQRHLSQLALSIEAQVSPRHLCFVETGRSQPSREMVLRLAAALDVPLRARNAWLLAAGYAPVFSESKLDAPGLAIVRAALDAILAQQEPYPAVVLDRTWNIVGSNRAAERFFGLLLEGRKASEPPNVLRMMFHRDALRPLVRNWHEVGEALIRRAHREAVGGVPDESLSGVLREILSYPGVPRGWDTPDPSALLLPIIPVTFAKDGEVFRYFSTVTTLGTAQDVTVQEVRIECFFPVDEATRTAARRLSGVA